MKHSRRALTRSGIHALDRRIDTKAAHAEQIGTCLTMLREVA